MSAWWRRYVVENILKPSPKSYEKHQSGVINSYFSNISIEDYYQMWRGLIQTPCLASDFNTSTNLDEDVQFDKIKKN